MPAAIEEDFSTRFSSTLASTTLTAGEKNLLNACYLNLVEESSRSNKRVKILYSVLTNAITVLTVINVSIIPIQRIDGLPPSGSWVLFWLSWAAAALILTAHKLMSAFDLSRRNVIGSATLAKLESEGWTFVSSSGRYKDLAISDSFKLFCDRVERLRLCKIGDAGSGKTVPTEASEILAMSPGPSRPLNRNSVGRIEISAV